MRQALLIVDMQEAFFNHPEYHLHQMNELVTILNELIHQAREKDMPVIFIQHTSDDSNDEFFEGSEDWQIHHGLARLDGDEVIQKTRWDAFYKTGLQSYLQAHDIEQLIIAGAQTEFCLDTTIRTAYSLGYQHNLMVANSHSTVDGAVLEAEQIKKHHESIWHNRFLRIVPAI